MHKNTKLLPYQREKLYERWQAGEKVTHLADYYDISRETVYEWLRRARLGEFANRLSINHRYQTLQYGLKKLSKVEAIIAKRQARQTNRYEKQAPGELVHFDNAKLPAIASDSNKKREHLHVAVDDYSRYLVADIFPDKTQWSSAIHLEEAVLAMPFDIQTAYSDNGKEYKGRPADHRFMLTCQEYGIKQSFTKPATPKTNGKAERVIRTLLSQWHDQHRFTSRAERQRSLDEFVRYYNQQRPHQGLNGQTPKQRLDSYLPKTVKEPKTVNNA
jgi:transposase InsO family protein